MKLSR
jgi:hypothetical protein